MRLIQRCGIGLSALVVIPAITFRPPASQNWESKFIKLRDNGTLQYIPDERGNIIPDFSRVGYHENNGPLPEVPVVKTIEPGPNSEQVIADAIAEVARISPDKNGFRGAILLKKGVYTIPGTIQINTSGIVLRGEGNDTKLVASGAGQRSLISISGTGGMEEIAGSRVTITDDYVPTGAFSFHVQSAAGFAAGDRVILYRPGTDAWVKDLKMDQIEARNGTKQWQAKDYGFRFERVITKTEGNTIFIDNPVVMALDKKYGGAELYKYSFNGRINEVGIENMYCESAFASDTDENHGWSAILFNKIQNGWARNITSRYFGFSCINVEEYGRNITVQDCNCFDAKSQVTGGRRYSFNNTGQLNLFMDCHATEGRHDYVTGARACGPNVFYHCTASKTHADIGPHHRWAMGTLYDNIVTDGEINIQDRGNWGSGHGWSGVTQVLWNCTALRAAVQSPWVSGRNYCIGLTGGKYEGRLKGRPDGEWEGQNKKGLQPSSLYMAQLVERKTLRQAQGDR